MKKYLSNIIMVCLFLVCAVCFGMYYNAGRKLEQAQDSYKQAEEIVKESEDGVEAEKTWTEAEIDGDENIARLSDMDINSLKEINEDVLGWIEIPGTKLSYPLMDGVDNEYYLKHTWDKKANPSGAVFVERLNKNDLSDLHSVIYAHRMMDGSMFGSLKYYDNEDYFKEHPYIYIVNDSGVHRYEIFSAYEAEVGSKTYQIGFKDDDSRQQFMDHCKEKSVIETGVTPTLNDKVLTLSTCTAFGSTENRFVVQAVLRGK